MFAKIKSLAKEGFFHILVGNTLTKMIAFISSFLLARLVDKSSYAHLTSADNMYSYIVMLYGLGMPSALLINCTVKNEKGKNNAYLKLAFKYGSLVQIILSIGVVMYATYVELPFPQVTQYVYILAFYPLLNHLIDTYQSYLRANLMNKEYALASFIQTFALFIGNVVLLKWLGTTGNVIARYVALVITLVYLIYISKKLFDKNKVRNDLTKNEIVLFLKQSISFLIANYFSGIMPQNEMSLVNQLIKNETVTANYKVAVMIPAQLSFVTSSIMVFFFPKIAQMKDPFEIRKKSKQIAIGTFLVVAVISLIGFLFSPFIIRLFYGDRFDDAIQLASIFWIVNGINAGFRMVPGNILPAIGEYKYNAFLSIATCGVHFAIEYIMINNYGINGVAIGSALVYLVTGIIFWAYLLRTLKQRESETFERGVN